MIITAHPFLNFLFTSNESFLIGEIKFNKNPIAICNIELGIFARVPMKKECPEDVYENVSGNCPGVSKNCHENVRKISICPENIQKIAIFWTLGLGSTVQKISGILQFSRHFQDRRTFSGHSFFIGNNKEKD